MISRPKRPQIIEDVDIDEFIDGVDNYVKDLNRYIDKLEKALAKATELLSDMDSHDCCTYLRIPCGVCPYYNGERYCDDFANEKRWKEWCMSDD